MTGIILFIFICILQSLRALPDFITKDESWKVGLYREYRVSCTYQTDQLTSHKVVWSRDFRALKTEKIIEQEINCTDMTPLIHCVRSTLYFTPFCTDHYGIYQCYLVPVEYEENFITYPRRIIQLFMDKSFWAKTSIIMKLPKYACSSRNVLIECNVDSDISPALIMISQILENNTIRILKSIQQPESNNSCKAILDHLSLTLPKVQEEHSGTYACKVLHPFENIFKKKEGILRVNKCSHAKSASSRPKSYNRWIVSTVTIVILIVLVLVVFVIVRQCRKVKAKFMCPYDYSSVCQFVFNNDIDISSLSISKSLGEGEFGVVYLGSILIMGRSQNVAIKVLKYNSNISEISDFCQELNIMKNIGEHKNVIQYLGYEYNVGSFKIVMEYATNGTLLELLRLHRRSEELSEKILIQFAMDVACGMEYLSSLKLVHRDLAARNVLVTEGWTLKIADFGLTRSVCEYYRQRSQGKVPIRWLALESIKYKMYTTMSDVWAFGILMWEIFSMGGIPYPDVVNVSFLATEIKNGKRNKIPDYASDELFEIMERTWRVLPTERPTFSELFNELFLLKEFASNGPLMYTNI